MSATDLAHDDDDDDDDDNNLYFLTYVFELKEWAVIQKSPLFFSSPHKAKKQIKEVGIIPN